MSDRLVRRLSAIMFADIVGYTAMMQKSEQTAVDNRNRFRRLLAECTSRHGGEAVQHYGDGTLSVFPSAVEATECALAVQRGMRAAPEVPLRIGLHVGDVVRDREGVYGNGVNIAARVQALAAPGSILLTDRVADEVRSHSALELVRLGKRRLKNVERPVTLFAVADEQIVVPDPDDLPAPGAAGPSVAVLPFVNMSGDPEREFFADGISEEIITRLAASPDLKVTSRTSSFAFKGKPTDVREIARTLDVRHVLEGSVRTSGRRVRVTAQLIDAESGFHVFSENWDRDLEDVLVIQDEIADAIAVSLHAVLASGAAGDPDARDGTPAGGDPGRDTARPDPEAYDLYLQARHHWNRWSPEGALRSIELYRRALDQDEGLALAHAGLASSYTFLGAIGRLPSVDAYREAQAWALRALATDPASAEAEIALGLTALFYEWNAERAERRLERALALSPGLAAVHHYRGMTYTILGRHAAAVAALERAVELDPLSPPVNGDLARALMCAGQLEAALEQIEKTLAIAPSFRSVIETKALTLWMAGDAEGALAAVDAYRALSPAPFAGAAILGYIRARMGDIAGALEQHQRLEERERTRPGKSLDLDFAVLYLGMRKFEWSLGRLEKAADSRAGGVVFVVSNPLWRELADHPRFRQILERIGLWTSS